MEHNELEGYCHVCQTEKWSQIEAEVIYRGEDEPNYFYWCYKHRILRCKTCGSMYYQREETNSEEYDQWYERDGTACIAPTQKFRYYPEKPKWQRPKWNDSLVPIDMNLAVIFLELYTAFDHDLSILTTIGIRTAFDRLSVILDVDEDLPFRKKISALSEKGYLSRLQTADLDILINAGNAAAHRGWSPEEGEIRHLLEVLEAFTYQVLFISPQIQKMREKIPKRLGDKRID